MNVPVTFIFDDEGADWFCQINHKLGELYEGISNLVGHEYSGRPGSSPYYLYPLLFIDSPRDYPKEALTKLCEIAVLCLDICLFEDKTLDEQIVPEDFLLYSKIYSDRYFIRLLATVVNHNDIFWQYYERYYYEYVNAVMAERKNHFSVLNNYEFHEFIKIAKGKPALAKIIPAAISSLDNSFETISAYEMAMDELSIALQLFDDLKDWKEDLRKGRYSWLLTRIITEHNLPQSTSEKEVSQILFKGEYDIQQLHLANQYFENSIIKSPGTSSWVRYVRYFSMRANKLLVDLLELRGESVESCDYYYRNNSDCPEVSQVAADKILQNSIEFLIGEQRRGFPELKHWMLDGENPEAIRLFSGDLFQRALQLNLVLEAYDEAADKYNLKMFVENEVAYICTSKSKHYDCGWTYIDDLKDNCPDLDTFAEVLRINSKVNDSKLDLETAKTLHKVFDVNKDRDYFSTWIIRDTELDYNNIAKRFGFSTETDVSANFISSLDALDKKTYSSIIKNHANYLYSLQNEAGYWDSSWYVGHYYCGYVLSRLFDSVADKEVIDKCANYIVTTQHKNGAWGYRLGNPLESSFAILTLLNISSCSYNSKVSLALERGIAYLLQTVTAAGYWYGSEFIKMGIGKEGASNQFARYRSATLTTAFCFNALYRYKSLVLDGACGA
jgi:hypothetical protein